jgi:hypothetical protein
LLCCPQIKNGAQFISETDTEVIPKLLKFAYDNWEGERLPFPKVGAASHVAYACMPPGNVFSWVLLVFCAEPIEDRPC